MNTQIALLIFNRPDKTAKVLEVIRQAKPKKLFVIADGPRQNHSSDLEQCAATRQLIEQIDWDCEVFKNYSDYNLGCAKRVSSGLDWVFDHVDKAIVLEDDCVPQLCFFPFCEELLERYQDDERIMVVAGSNVQRDRTKPEYDYYFSRYNHCWGWATWKRAWQHFDYEMQLWPEVRDNGILEDILQDARHAESWSRTFQLVYENKINSWAFRWTFACWMQSGLSILPSVNLVSNIGFDHTATHTKEDSAFLGQPTGTLNFPLSHPSFLVRDSKADTFTQQTHFNYHPRLVDRIIGKLKQLQAAQNPADFVACLRKKKRNLSTVNASQP